MTPQKEDLAELLAQEEELTFESFSNEMAISLGLLMVESAAKQKLPAAVDITRSGQQLFFAAMPGTSPDNAHWIRRKMTLVNRYQHSSFYIGCLHRSRGTDFYTATGLPQAEYAPNGGCFPILIRNTGIIGKIMLSRWNVSGLSARKAKSAETGGIRLSLRLAGCTHPNHRQSAANRSLVGCGIIILEIESCYSHARIASESHVN